MDASPALRLSSASKEVQGLGVIGLISCCGVRTARKKKSRGIFRMG